MVYEISTSITVPLKQLAIIETIDTIRKVLKVGQELVLGCFNGYIQMIDIKELKIIHTKQFEEIGNIYNIIAIEDSEQLLLVGTKGLMKATKDQAIKHYFQGKRLLSICLISESFYLLGFYKDDGLIVWNEHSDQQLYHICPDRVFSIKRILYTNTYIIKTKENGLKLLYIKNFEKLKYSLQHLLNAEEVCWNSTDDSL